MSSKGLGFVAFFASVEDSYVSLIISHAKISVLETFNVFKRVDFFLGFFCGLYITLDHPVQMETLLSEYIFF